MLRKKLKKAEAGIRATLKVYQEQLGHVGEDKGKLYLEMEKKAQTERGDSLRVYEISTQAGESVQLFLLWC
jgi:hypothetical protein